MTPSPLDLPDLIAILVVAWICGLVVALGDRVVARYRGVPAARPILVAGLRWVCFASLFTIFGIAQRANFLGLISYRLYVFIVFTAALAVAGAGLAVRYARSQP